MFRPGIVLASLILVTAIATNTLAAETAQSSGNPPAGGMGLKSWGLRAGLSVDPDQVVGGIQWDVGRIVPNLRLQPNLELGLGDDKITLFGSLPVHYLFHIQSAVTPYAGAGVSVGIVNRDRPASKGGDDTSVEAGLRLIGGLEWKMKSGKPFAVEMNIGIGDVADFQAKAVWSF
ncbi:MAG TPA: hypothetical protein ENK16_00545 [Chromatiales bacterium]|nr:hypothetical protein [Chromatiales bacterium]